jgi:sialidase-1
VPAYRVEKGHRSLVIFSDDHGENWRLGDPVPSTNPTSECEVVELEGGKLLIDARVAPDRHPTRLFAVSSDEGQTWTGSRTGLPAPAIKASILRITLDGNDCLLWIGPRGPGRANLAIRISADGGQTFPEEHLLYTGWSGYSDVRLLADGTIGILWEVNEGRTIVYSRFDLPEFLSKARPRYRADVP